MGLLSGPPHTTLFEVLRRHAELDEDRPWLTFERDDGESRSWTYGDFTREVELTADRLAKLGLGRGSTFVVSLDNHPELIRLVLAASATGCIAVPADTRLTERELGDYIDVSGARVLLARPAHEPAVAAAAARGMELVPVGDPLDDPAPASVPSTPAGNAGEVFELLFTSGTTSKPKGVMLTSGAVIHGACAFAAGAGYTSDDVPLVALPLFHAAAQMHQLWPTLVRGGRAVVVERFSRSPPARPAPPRTQHPTHAEQHPSCSSQTSSIQRLRRRSSLRPHRPTCHRARRRHRVAVCGKGDKHDPGLTWPSALGYPHVSTTSSRQGRTHPYV